MSRTMSAPRKEREDEPMLAQHDDRLRALAQHSSSDIAVIDVDGRLVYAVPSAEGMGVLGYSLPDLAGQNVFELTHPADRHLAEIAFAEVASTALATRTVHVRLQHVDGRHRHIEVVATNHLADPAIKGVVLNLQDVTANITAEHRQDIFLDMLGDLDVSMVVLQREGVIRANAAFCELAGYDEETLQGLPSAFDLIVEGAEELHTQLGRNALGQRTKARHECTLRRGTGEQLHVEVTFRVGAAEEDGEFIAIVQDITARKAREAEREEELARTQNEVVDLRQRLGERLRSETIVGDSAPMKRLFAQIQAAASAASPQLRVLIRGETGTGKELVARAIHREGPRNGTPFVSVNCPSITDSLFESALFGHEKGAFTGAISRHVGHFEEAQGGTLFLDEVAEMDVLQQAKLLRVLQERRIRRLGGSEEIALDAQVVAATNRDLERAMVEGSFREDLYYRLTAFEEIIVPPLRDRREDIPQLIEHFLARWASLHDADAPAVSPDVFEWFTRYEWPGNVRVLEHAVNSAAQWAVLDSGVIELEHLPPRLVESSGSAPADAAGSMGLRQLTEAYQCQVIESALEACDGQITKTAEMLDVDRSNLRVTMRRLGIVWGND
jgi:two-component system, NtrC family, response regulator AtoC